MADGKGSKRYPYIINGRIPEDVNMAVEEYVEMKREDYPKYNSGDLLRTALVRFLKDKGYLNNDKNYL